MSEKKTIEEVVKRFVHFTWERGWDGINNKLRLGEADHLFSTEDFQVVFELCSVAGFEPSSIKLGRLTLNGKVNPFSPFIIVGEEGEDNEFATGWLNDTFSIVESNRPGPEDFHKNSVDENHKNLCLKLKEEVMRSIPLEPIRLNERGDLLIESARGLRAGSPHYFVNHGKDEDKLGRGMIVGVHKYCGMLLDRRRATKTGDAIVCRICGRLTIFPKVTETYGELRKALQDPYLDLGSVV